VIRPVLGYPTFTVVMITIGVGYVLRGVVTMVPGWGTETYSLKTPFGDSVLRIGGAVIARIKLATIGLTAALCLVLYLFFRFASSASPCRRPRRTSLPPTTWASRCSA
jgi:branched-chain amino acid transport system permease protein